jgi:Flp pilus assembly pilin Flp
MSRQQLEYLQAWLVVRLGDRGARLAGAREGQSLVEYAIGVSIVLALVIVAVRAFGTALATSFSNMATELTNFSGSPGG